jgi:hypothetical protein
LLFFGKVRSGSLKPISSTLFGINNPTIKYSVKYAKPGYEPVLKQFEYYIENGFEIGA